MDAKFRHLGLIQGTINRLATNSFQIKGWSVVLVAAILVLLAREKRLDASLIVTVPVVVFWGLDGYFLWQERLFRALYDHVRQLKEDEDVDFSMKTNAYRTDSKRSWICATFSITLLTFYFTLGALAVGLAMIVRIQGDIK